VTVPIKICAKGINKRQLEYNCLKEISKMGSNEDINEGIEKAEDTEERKEFRGIPGTPYNGTKLSIFDRLRG
jgi:hypothetical protein